MLKSLQYKIENLLQFSLTNCVELFLRRVAFSIVSGVHTTVCQYFDSDTDSHSDCELADLLRVVVDSQLNAYVLTMFFSRFFIIVKTCLYVFLTHKLMF